MIVVRLTGGLGNQMFQYAAGRRLAYAHNATLKLDLSWFGNIPALDTSRRYELGIFAIREDFASFEEIGSLRREKGKFPGRIFGSLARLAGGQTHIREKHYHFDPAILKLPDNVYLEGYWQSEKYFKDIEDIIREEFTIRMQPDEYNREMAECISNTEAVSVHVRRGDFVTNPVTRDYHGACPPDYYNRARQRVLSHVRNPHFFVFSDDPDWTRENLHFDHPVLFIDRNRAESAYEDLRLISLCRHHIIANSSFSWWGAWLGSHPDKIVIAPEKWFRDDRINTRDVSAEKWIRIR